MSIPKTIYFNFKVLPVSQAIKFPYIVSYHVKLSGINRKTFLTNDKDLSTCSMRIGFGDSITSRRESPKSLLCVEEGTEKVDNTVYIWYNVSIKYRRCFYDRTTAEIGAKSIHGNI